MELQKFKRCYVLADIITAAISWILFYFYRKFFIESHLYGATATLHWDYKFFLGVIFIPLFWFIVYYSTGYYNNVLRKTRLEDFGKTFLISFIGISILFFFLILDDFINSYKNYYDLYLVLLLLHFCLTFIARVSITSYILNRETKGLITFKTLIIGRVEKIKIILNELTTRYPDHGHQITGYIPVTKSHDKLSDMNLKKLGEFNDIHDIVKQENAEDVIIALNEYDAELYHKIIYSLNSSNVVVKVNSDLFSIVKGQVVISSLFRYPLIQVSRDLLPAWQASLKQLIDIAVSLFAIILTSPLVILLAIAIKLNSKGPIIYTQERIGRFGKPFTIYKFRSMYKDAETHGPLLATTDDVRITSIGRFMRRNRFDEIPNFINVIKGEMSLVGPRPERKYYIDQLIQQVPQYTRLLQIKPGVTSWGQVKYGYAENIDEMIRRMRYDLLYLENMSLYVDFQILVRTILTLFQGKGK
jgi:exopolysaccharide biosynthesis polyprenyl glycosylphosphotransferase